MQTAGGGVGAAAELAPGMQFGEDHLHTGETGARLDVDGDATAVVAHLHRTVGQQDDLDPVTEPAEGLVHRVVDDLPETVHQPTAVRRADVHARALAHSLEPLEDLKVPGRVVLRHEWGAPSQLLGWLPAG